MRNQIIVGIVTLFIGGISGYFFQQWNERNMPFLLISSVNFDEADVDELSISIPEHVQILSRESRWFSNLGKEQKISELKKSVEDDLSETVIALEKMTSVLPKMRKYVKQHQDDISVESAKDFRNFQRENADVLSLSYLTMNIAGLIKRNEVSLEIIGSKNHLDQTYIPPDKKSLDDIESALKSQQEQSAVVALKLVTDWHPKDLLACLNIIIERTGEQATLNRKIRDELLDIIKSSARELSGVYLSITATLSNNGERTISFDKYAVMSLSGLDEPIFLELIENTNGGISLAQGATKDVVFKSRTPLPASLSEKLKTMYNTDFIRCKMATKLLSSSVFSSEWVESEIATLSSFNTSLELKFAGCRHILVQC